MSRALKVITASPGMTIQDQGRPGMIGQGLSVGGAADRLALSEGAALLGQSDAYACIECAAMGGVFEALADMRIALTGAPMQATIDGAAVAWNASHALRRGQRLQLGPARRGIYGYLHLGGGLATKTILNAKSAHLVAHIGGALQDGDELADGPDTGGDGAVGGVGLTLDPSDRFGGGTLRIVASVQTARFGAEAVQRLQTTTFSRNPRGNRMGAAMEFDGPPFIPPGGLNILSEMVVPGDIQITGDGTPFVLLYECQTTGGYPRIGTVIPPDLPRAAQARANEPIRFELIDRAAALAALQAYESARLTLTPKPLIRDPHDIPDLLAYQLIDGMITGTEESAP